MDEDLWQSVNQIPHGGAFLAVGLAVIVLQLAALGVARKRRARGLENHTWPVLAGVAILTLPAFAGLSVHAARAALGKGLKAALAARAAMQRPTV